MGELQVSVITTGFKWLFRTWDARRGTWAATTILRAHVQSSLVRTGLIAGTRRKHTAQAYLGNRHQDKKIQRALRPRVGVEIWRAFKEVDELSQHWDYWQGCKFPFINEIVCSVWTCSTCKHTRVSSARIHMILKRRSGSVLSWLRVSSQFRLCDSDRSHQRRTSLINGILQIIIAIRTNASTQGRQVISFSEFWRC